jgi:hypothetical protein
MAHLITSLIFWLLKYTAVYPGRRAPSDHYLRDLQKYMKARRVYLVLKAREQFEDSQYG